MSKAAPAARSLVSWAALHFFGGFNFQINDLASGLCRLGEDFELGGEWTVKSSAVRLATAGGDNGDILVFAQKLFQVREGVGGLGEGIESQLEEFEMFDSRFGPVEQFGWRSALNGHAEFSDAQTWCGGGRGW